MFFLTDIPGALQYGVEIRGAAGVFAVAEAIGPVFLIQFARLLLKAVSKLAAFLKEMAQPVIALPVRADGVPHTLGRAQLKSGVDGFLRAFDHPGHDVGTGVLHQIIGVVLDVALALNLRAKGDHDQPPPCAVVAGSHLGQVIGV